MFRVNGTPILVERYPDGTPRLHIGVSADDSAGPGPGPGPAEATLEWLYEKDEEMLLYFITKHLREQCPARELTFIMPYIPHARMDRVRDRREVFTLKYFCEFVNALRFDKVIVRDAHSNVSLALLNNVVSEPIGSIIKKLVGDLLKPERDIVFYPDEGSCKRYAERVGFPCAFGVKNRDWRTGKITGLDVRGDLPPSPFDVLIIDDISSYGGTFYHAAKKLKELGAGRIFLYVTHCENAILEGDLIGSGLLERIYTTRSIYTGNHPLITLIGDHDE